MMRYLTHLGGATSTLGVALLFVLLPGSARQLGVAMLLANVVSHACVQVLKRTVARHRPAAPDGRPLALLAHPDPFSFPSGHAAAAAAVATPVLLWEPLAGIGALSVAIAVAASRVRLRMHYVGDVVVGFLLGTAAGIMAFRLVR